MKVKLLIFFLVPFSFQLMSYECSFNTSAYIEKLDNPANIELLKITFNKHKKYVKDVLKIATSPSENIDPELKKKYKGLVEVAYKFGTCKMRAEFSINGDWKDHISFREGQIFNSLKVRLREGNILSKVKFKLLLPKTRNGINEVFGALFLKKLGYISPTSSIINTEVNGVQGNLLFQESDAKELLEDNKRRESAIFEGDENLTWIQNDEISLFELNDIAAARQVNTKWALKGPTSTEISLSSYLKIQNEFLNRRSQSEAKSLYYFNPNPPNKNEFSKYHLLILAVNGAHSLKGHNRKFFWNSLKNQFEPIYYDGNIKIESIRSNIEFNDIDKKELGFFLSEFEDLNFSFLYKKINALYNEKFYKDFADNASVDIETAREFCKKALEIIIKNIEFLENKRDTEKFDKPFSVKEPQYQAYLANKINEYPINIKYVGIKKYINNLELYEIYCFPIDITCEDSFINQTDLMEIISKNSLDESLTTLLKGPNINEEKVKNFKSKEIFIKFTGNSFIELDEKNKILTLNQAEKNDWFLIENSNLKDFLIEFKGAKKNVVEAGTSSQRFNQFGLTGCLTIYNSFFDNTSLYADQGFCEDVVNLISSKGDIDKLSIDFAAYDALDIDFSEINIDTINIIEAGNDCVDVSSGRYSLNSAFAQYCGDKALSVGESSYLDINNLKTIKSSIGLSSKDSSIVNILSIEATDTDICLESKKKKQEFNGALINLITNKCNNKNFYSDKYSQISIKEVSEL